jgi:hypothetical protein
MQYRVTAMERMTFDAVIKKLETMNPNARRTHPCWLQLKALLKGTGNWKGAPRGKPNLANLAKKNAVDFDAAY